MALQNRWSKILTMGISLVASLAIRAQVNVTTWHNDLSRTGANAQETLLTTANVNVTNFGKLFSVAVDGQVYAQPLYLSGVSIAGGTHNVLYVATQHDSVYAIDADSGTIYAQVSLIPAGGTTVSSSGDLSCGDIDPEVGITGTPVIDPASNTLYVVSKAKINGNIVQHLHALSALTLAEQHGGPVQIQGSVPGTAKDGNGTTVTFDPRLENQRPGLVLENGHVLIAWGGHCDNPPYHGWLMSYNAATLTQEAVWNTTPNAEPGGSTQTPAGGIWMAGSAPAVDANGDIYLSTGNGYWNGSSNEYSDSVVKLGPPANNTFPVIDYFTPFDQGGPGDSDVGSAGLVLFPTTSSGAQLLAQQGKQGTIYLVDRNNLGKNCVNLSPACTSSDTQVPQELRQATAGVLSSPLYWNGHVYWNASNDFVYSWSVDPASGLLSTLPTSRSTQQFARTAASSLSANGTTNGIVWLMNNTGELLAFDATDLTKVLWTSGQASGNRDSAGSAVKFAPPTIVNGKVYVGTLNSAVAYGLLNATTTTPTFSPGAGTYSGAQSVTIKDATPGATIYYTTDGSTPTTSSSKYSGPVTVSASETLRAIAVANGLNNSAVASATYTINSGSGGGPTATPTFTPAAGSYTGAQSVTISDATTGATIYYTTNGTTPTTASTVYTGPITVSASETLEAIAVASGQTASSVASAAYTISAPTTATPTFTPAAGTYTSAQSVTIADATTGATIYYTTNGTAPTTASAVYGGPISVSASETLEAIAVAAGHTASPVATASYTINTGGTSPPPAVNDPNGFPSAAGFTVVGGAAVTGGALQLTDGGNFEARAIWYSTPLNIQSFSTDFEFQITPASANASDGLTFTIQNAGLNAHGGIGGALGYQGIKSSVAVKFDTFNNAGEGVNSTGFYTNGAAPTVPALDLTPSGVNLHSGDIMHVHVSYNGTTLSLAVIDTVTNATFTASQAINIPATVGANTAFIGFTGGTGGTVSTQNILNWIYTPGTSTSTTTPPPTPSAATPAFTPATGTYTSPQSVTISDATPGATIYYTTNGTTPTSASAVYTGPMSVGASETLQAIAVASGYTASAVATAAYTINTGSTPPAVNYPTGFTSSTSLSLVGGASLAASALQLTDGGNFEARAIWYSTPVNIQRFTTDFQFQITPASAKASDGMTFTIQNAGLNAHGGIGGALGYQGIKSSVAVKFDTFNNVGEGVNSTGFYTNGAAPTIPALDLTPSGVNLHSGDVMHAHLSYDGTTLTLLLTDTTTNATFTASQAINIPATVGANSAYVGFTAGTGGTVSTQDVLNWTYAVN
jgi:Chitobiase/beta-hexosaminidase C-terminal domain/Legume lectin domain